MKKRNVGRSGLQVTLVGLGCNNFGGRIDLEASRKVVHKALDLGITLFDTADIYGNSGGSEEYLGQILGDRRKDIVLATKFGMPMDEAETQKGASRRYIMSAVEGSLRRLRTDWIDLYQLHAPDPLTPIEETLRALADLVHQGKVRYIGCSNLPAWQVVEAQWTARQPGLEHFISCQDEYSLLVRDIERELLPAMQAHGMGLLPYFPLASGLLTGKYQSNAPLPADARLTNTQRLAERYLTEANWRIVDRLQAFAAARGRSLLELAFSWLAAQPAVASVIAGATKPEQVEQNVSAVDWTLTAEDLAEIDRLSAHSQPGLRFRQKELTQALAERDAAEAERSKRELQLHRAQNLSSVGRLSGGLGHVLNNALTVVIGYAELIGMTVKGDRDVSSTAEEISRSATRAAGMAQQFPSFNQRQRLQPQTAELNDLLHQLKEFAAPLLGQRIDRLTLSAACPGVKKAEASMTGGTLAGADQAEIRLADTGSGMTPEVREHAFEPFFSTKDPSQGAGLAQHGSWLHSPIWRADIP